MLQTTAQYLGEKGIPSPRLDAELLLARVLGMSRVQLYCAFDRPLRIAEVDFMRGFVRRRAKGEPVAYLLGEKEFYGLPFFVDSRVLIPRPETEHLVDRALEIIGTDESARVMDIGTGSGAISVALAVHRPNIEIFATDISRPSLEVAAQNAKAHGVESKIHFIEGDLFADCPGPFSLIVSNPPYIDRACSASLAPDVLDFEPAGALFAEDGGMAVVQRIIGQAPPYCAEGAVCLIEIGHDQADRAARAAEEKGSYRSVTFIKDYSGRRRIMELRPKSEGQI